MGKLCKLTGVEIPEEGREPILKKMCLNCESCIENNDGTFSCNHEKVMEAGRNKIMAAVPDGFEIETLTLKPMNLKNPTKKCNNYSPDFSLIHELVEEMYR